MIVEAESLTAGPENLPVAVLRDEANDQTQATGSDEMGDNLVDSQLIRDDLIVVGGDSGAMSVSPEDDKLEIKNSAGVSAGDPQVEESDVVGEKGMANDGVVKLNETNG